ncbi:dual specificity phosphatase, catalytic domain-containing protein [Ditylenchus destructor]|uniref:Dual specificity phosphatase, catalytic domain-containing protein n=1 Tax=Ditylenchus destructor TaxID=166010 RepID=A0AAD4RBL9_9BILA|nr:dual specificity phosphatase, catalytic domain-containing protein [Ditylenchus destructor]
MVRTNRKVPTEWERYEPIGSVIANTRIFALKTPLRLELQTKVPKSRKFSSCELFRKLAESGLALGLLINAANTERYYDRADIEGMCISYKDVLCPGRGFLDRNDLVKKFCKTIEDFLANNQDNELLIGVHCTNGVNRAGYLICRYLIDRLGWSSHQALEAFETARGYPIERGSYVQALHRADKEKRLKKRRAETENTPEAGSNEEDEDQHSEKDRKHKRKRRKEADSADGNGLVDGGDMSAFDPTLTAQMMQQFFQMEQQFKKAAEGVEQVYSTPYAAVTSQSHVPQNARHGTKAQHSSTFLSPSVVGSTATAAAIALQQYSATKMSGSADSSPYMNNSVSSIGKNNVTLSIATTTHSAGRTPEDIGDEDIDEEEEEISTTTIDFESMGKIDVKEVSASQQRRLRRRKLEKKFQVMKRGKFWEINELRKQGGL